MMKADIDTICEQLTLDELQCKLLHELLPKLCKCDGDGKPRKKRKPSKYNLHMKDCIPEKRAKEGVSVQDAFKQCAFEYKRE